MWVRMGARVWVQVQVADAQAQTRKEACCALRLVTAAEAERKVLEWECAAGVGLGPGLRLGPGLSGSTTSRLHHHLQCHVAAAVEGRGVARW